MEEKLKNVWDPYNQKWIRKDGELTEYGKQFYEYLKHLKEKAIRDKKKNG